MITGTVPPSTDHAAPATLDAASEHRNAITAAISSAPPNRPSGVRPAVDFSTSSRGIPRASAAWSASPPGAIHSSSPTGPGATAFTRTPRAAYRSANARESDSSAALVTEYAMLAPDGRLPDEEDTLTIRPQPRSAIAGAVARISRIGAIT